MTANGAGKLRLGVAAALFIAWLGWLLYLAMVTRHAIVLSRPQFLVSPLWVIASVEEKDGRPAPEVVVREVAWSQKPSDLVGSKITIADVSSHTTALGWAGPGEYILPLSEAQDGKKAYRITPLPASPGFTPAYHAVTLLATGKEKSELRQLLTRISGLDAKEVDKLLAPKTRVVFRNVSEADRQELESLEAFIRVQREESRIYPANDETRAQLQHLPRP